MRICEFKPCKNLKSCAGFIVGCLLFAGIAFGASNIVKNYLACDVMKDFISAYFDISTDDVDEILEILVKYRDNTKKIISLQNPDAFVGDLRKTTDDISYKKIEKLKEIQKLIRKQQSAVKGVVEILDSQYKEIEASIELIQKANTRFNEAYDKNLKLKNSKKTDGFAIFERNIKDD